MLPDPKITHQGLRVLKVFLDAFQENVRATLAGADIMRRARLTSGTIYPLLVRFEAAELLTSEWESQRPEDLGRPRRRLYRLTPRGAEFARSKLSEVMPARAQWVQNEA
jgi:PadR family transcriptional regulator PadR